MLFSLWERYRVAILTVGILLFVFGSFYFYSPTSEGAPTHPMEVPVYAEEKKAVDESKELKTSNSKENTTPTLMYVDVKGAVKTPGLYQIEEHERVHHLVLKAGGFLPQAELRQVNLAQPVTDGMMLYIPTKGERSTCSPALSLSPSTSSPTGASVTSVVSGDGKVNLNKASLQEFMTLPGIGETRAKTILSYREKNGPFTSIDQLKKVSGIGDKTFEKLKSKLTVE